MDSYLTIGCSRLDSHGLATILDLFRPILVILGLNLYLTLQHCDTPSESQRVSVRQKGMEVSILFGCQTWVVEGTLETFWSAAVAVYESQGRCFSQWLSRRCRPGFDVCALDKLYVFLLKGL